MINPLLGGDAAKNFFYIQTFNKKTKRKSTLGEENEKP
jgi:hypothetical protein